jgi:hypothetical protein
MPRDLQLTTLNCRDSGRYRVGTESGSTYLFDLDQSTVCRTSSGIEEIGADLRYDGDTVHLLLLIDCSVGRRMALLIDLHLPGVYWTHRTSTRVLTIAEVGPEDAH